MRLFAFYYLIGEYARKFYLPAYDTSHFKEMRQRRKLALIQLLKMYIFFEVIEVFFGICAVDRMHIEVRLTIFETDPFRIIRYLIT